MAESERAQQLDQYFTPPALAKAFVEWADIKPGATVLEPSAGDGALVRWIPDHVRRVTAIDVKWANGMGPVIEAAGDKRLTVFEGDSLIERGTYDVAIMNPPYGYVIHEGNRVAADRLHVQHALRHAKDVYCLVRANFLWGQDRYNHILRYARVLGMAVLVRRPNFVGPALHPDQTSPRHDYCCLHLTGDFRAFGNADMKLGDVTKCDVKMEYWNQDWKLDPAK